MPRRSCFSAETRDRALRMVFEQQDQHDSQWAAITAIAEMIGCHRETLRNWVRQAETDQGSRPGISTDERDHLKELERENRERRRANTILRQASAYSAAAELDRQRK